MNESAMRDNAHPQRIRNDRARTMSVEPHRLQRTRDNVSARMRSAEARLLDRPPATTSGARVTRWLPLLMMATIALWTVAPDSWLRTLTPWVGAAALLCAGIYLARVVLRIGRFYWRHLAPHSAESPATLQLRRAVYQTVVVLVATLLLAAGFFVLSTQLLSDSDGALQSRLLWALTVGGMILSLFFGELVTRLIEAMDAMLSDQEARESS